MPRLLKITRMKKAKGFAQRNAQTNKCTNARTQLLPAVGINSWYPNASNGSSESATESTRKKKKFSHNCISRINKTEKQSNRREHALHIMDAEKTSCVCVWEHKREQIKFLTLSNRKIDALNVRSDDSQTTYAQQIRKRRQKKMQQEQNEPNKWARARAMQHILVYARDHTFT